MKSKEHELQAACVKWFSLQYPQYDRMLFAIPNGGHRDIRTAARLKAEGVKRGVPDLFLSIPRGGYNGLYIEMKYGDNKLTADQEKFFNQATELGYLCLDCYTVDEFIDIITGYFALTNINGIFDLNH